MRTVGRALARRLPAPGVGSTPPGRGDPARAALWLFLALCLLYASLTRGHFVSTDEVEAFETTAALWQRGELSIPPVINSVPGRGGRFYDIRNPGIAAAALPHYALGRAADRLLEQLDRPGWRALLAGPPLSLGSIVWGGRVEIFFVSLFSAIPSALLAAVFFALSVRLGATPRAAAAAALLVALTSHLLPYATTFFQHPAESLFLLWSFYFLVGDARRPAAGARALAGALLGAAILVRVMTAVALPALAVYAVRVAWARAEGVDARRLRACARALVPFALPVAGALALHLVVNWVKFGHLTVEGGYAVNRFTFPFLTSLHGLLLSPGKSLFVYTPLLLLLPWMLPPFLRRHPLEASCVAGLFCSFLLFVASVEIWHGDWCIGPRYLLPTLPFLLLPLGAWLERAGRGARCALAGLALLGVLVQVPQVAVNFSFVFARERYKDYRPPGSYNFLPAACPLAGCVRGLLAGDDRVDLWLVHVRRRQGGLALLAAATPLALLLALAADRLRRAVAALPAAPAPEASFRRHARPALLAGALVVAATLLVRWLDVG